jgi:hypothetical protein
MEDSCLQSEADHTKKTITTGPANKPVRAELDAGHEITLKGLFQQKVGSTTHTNRFVSFDAVVALL